MDSGGLARLPTRPIEQEQTARGAAFLAALASWRGEGFAVDFLRRWQLARGPDLRDVALSQEICLGSIRMARALDSLLPRLKRRERTLMQQALYQHLYMDRIPLYAIVNETLELAKKYCHKSICGWINVFLRNECFSLPADPPEVKYSCTDFFHQRLEKTYLEEEKKQILEAGTRPPPVLARLRPGFEQVPVQGPEKDRERYVQNATSCRLMEILCKNVRPSSVLDLCAAPGGKSLILWDQFPGIQLVVNDVSERKLQRLEENSTFYGAHWEMTAHLGESYPLGRSFDLVLVDTPCSNSGVLGKKPEARWRLVEGSVQELVNTQKKLMEQASKLAPCIAYMTCSILPEENKDQVQAFLQDYPFKLICEELILPGGIFDGGYLALLQRK